MKVSDISTATVLIAVHDADSMGMRGLDLLIQRTGAPEKVAFRAMERDEAKGLLEVGVSVACAWLSEKGRAELVKISKTL